MIKQIVCFANSRKPHGKCFAGKDIEDSDFRLLGHHSTGFEPVLFEKETRVTGYEPILVEK